MLDEITYPLPNFNGCTAVVMYGGEIRSHQIHDDVIKWKHFPRYWPFVRGIHRSPVNSPHKDQWRGALMFSFIWAWMNGWVNSRKVGELRRHCAQYDITVMVLQMFHDAHLFLSVDIEKMPTGALGMANGRIPDSAIWAKNYELARPAWTGRLRNDDKTMDRGFPTYFLSRDGQEQILFRVLRIRSSPPILTYTHPSTSNLVYRQSLI